MEPHAMLAKNIWRRLQLSNELISLVMKDIGLYLVRPPLGDQALGWGW